MIEQVCIKNYKSIKSLRLPLGRLNVLIGAYSGAMSASNSSLKRSKRCSLTYKK